MAVDYYYTQYLQQAVNQTYESIDIPNVSVSWSDFLVNTGGVAGTNQAGSYTGNYNLLGWVIKVYKKESPSSPAVLMTSDDVTVRFGAPDGPLAQYYKGVKITNGGKAFYIEVNYDNVLAAKKPLVLKPVMAVTLKSNGNHVSYSKSASGIDLQSVTFTQSQTYPPIPTALIAAVSPGYDPGLNNGNTSNIHYNFATKQYVGIQMVTDSKTNTTSYYALYYDPKTKKQVGDKVYLGKEKANSRGKVWAKGQALLIDAIDSQNKTSAVGDSTKRYHDSVVPDQPAATSPAPPYPTDSNRWNPPTHLYTKNFSTGLFLNSLIKNDKQLLDSTLNNSEILPGMEFLSTNYSVPSTLYSINTNLFEPSLGHIGNMYQDAATAKAINQDHPDKQWGFRFMYNPNQIGYSNTADNSVDYTLGQADPANLLAGNMTVNFQLYINRIIDMSYLRGTQAPGQMGYARQLTQDEKDGLTYRGTEYDLEFLYRVLGGDPIKNNATIGAAGNLGVSADIGLIKAVPIWLSINPVYKLFGAVASMSVNHVLFTMDMVPMLTTVDITFNRFPALFNLADSDPKSDSRQAFKKFITGKAQ
jgi:hypothetical protein